MQHHPLAMIYEYIEHAYVRQQAGDVLIRCLEEQDVDPMYKLVEELVIAGPQSIVVLREVIAETDQHRSEIQDRLHRLLVHLQAEWSKNSRVLPELPDMLLYSWLPADICIEMIVQDGMQEEQARLVYNTIVRKNRQNMLDMMDQLRILQDIGAYLQDWLWGLSYESYHQEYPYTYVRKTKHKL